MAMENGPVEDVFPIENGDVPVSHGSLLEGRSRSHQYPKSTLRFQPFEEKISQVESGIICPPPKKKKKSVNPIPFKKKMPKTLRIMTNTINKLSQVTINGNS